MSARDANARLSRRIRRAQPAYDRLAPFRPGDHSELPHWPSDAMDDSPRRMERITIPPGNRKVLVCDDYPDCGCIGDCELRPHGIDQAQSLLLVILVVLAILGLVLIWLGLR